MHVEITTRVVVTDGAERHLVTVERTVRKDVGDNRRFFVAEALNTAQTNTEDTVVSAAIALDRKAVTHD